MSTVNIEIELSRKKISNLFIKQIEQDLELRAALFQFFVATPNRALALAFLRASCALRKKSVSNISTEVIMLGCYILGLHAILDDSLEIWKAKCIDFDTFAGVDIQLIAFRDLSVTLDFLENHPSKIAKKAFQYTIEASKFLDFEQIEQYFSKENLPYYVGNVSYDGIGKYIF